MKKSVNAYGAVSPNFMRSEFECKCGCGFNEIDPELVYVVQDVRTHFGLPVNITSACRCKKHNKKVGGSAKSQHVLGTAADIVVRGVSASDVQDYIDNKFPDTYGIGFYSSFTHVDVRKDKARWIG